MTEKASVVEQIRTATARRVLFLPHAVRQMSRPERMISTAEGRHALINGELIEEYPDGLRGLWSEDMKTRRES